jgi:hypothetical protein
MYLIICPFRHETIDYGVEFQTMFELVLFMIEERAREKLTVVSGGA